MPPMKTAVLTEDMYLEKLSYTLPIAIFFCASHSASRTRLFSSSSFCRASRFPIIKWVHHESQCQAGPGLFSASTQRGLDLKIKRKGLRVYPVSRRDHGYYQDHRGAAEIEQYEASYCGLGGEVDNQGQHYDSVGSTHSVFPQAGQGQMRPGADLNCTPYRGFDQETLLYIVQRVKTILDLMGNHNS
ncbi:hypothetical protein EYF80_054535 [Liparis tanakae]|uniref:Uncharacterized protein n=1 Tax=Liparis tanakae TaxID=230148 RepID=A0A4Z2F2M5_9TELE|nr:hypothetical protein EYF80_054535 [Liparis tanakae]